MCGRFTLHTPADQISDAFDLAALPARVLRPRYNIAPYRDGTTHVVLKPHAFIARLVTLVPKPRGNLTCYHGVFIFIVFLVHIVTVE